MLMTKRKPATVGEILVQEFLEPMGLTQGVLAEAIPFILPQERVRVGGQGALEPALWLRSRRLSAQRRWRSG
jgi:hypothetical protein